MLCPAARRALAACLGEHLAMEYVSLIFIHVAFGVIWAGGAITAGLVVIPAVMEAGPAGGAVMGGIVKRKFTVVMLVSAILVVLTGVRMFMVRFSAEWLSTPEGIVLSLGALLGLGALGIGVGAQKPAAERLAALGGQVAASGGPPTAEQVAELAALRARLLKVARINAFHLLGATVLMASHRLFAAL
jgi:hypothetical protein